jgi:hypothetical protein
LNGGHQTGAAGANDHRIISVIAHARSPGQHIRLAKRLRRNGLARVCATLSISRMCVKRSAVPEVHDLSDILSSPTARDDR